jgi:hypothetical protein
VLCKHRGNPGPQQGQQAHTPRIRVVLTDEIVLTIPSTTVTINFCILPLLRTSPRDFTLVAASGRYDVHSFVISDISIAVSTLLAQAPDTRTFDLVGDFSTEVLTKLVSVLNGGTEIFLNSEYTILTAILSSLKVTPGSFPGWLLFRGGPRASMSQGPEQIQIQIDPSTLGQAINSMPRLFGIRTNSHLYNCPTFTLGFSPLLSSCSNLIEYRYDCDSTETVKSVANFLSGDPIVVSRLNADELRQIACDLELECLSLAVNNAILTVEQNQEKLEAEMSNFEADLHLQSSLFNLTCDTLNETRDDIVGCGWFSSQEETKEFVCNVLIVAETRWFMCDLLAHLVELLNDEFMLGYLERRLLADMNNDRYCRFLFSLYSRGLLAINKITDSIFRNLDRASRDLRPDHGMYCS